MVMLICSSFFHSPAPVERYSGCGAGSNMQFHKSQYHLRVLSAKLDSQVLRSVAQSDKETSFLRGSNLNLKPRSKRLLVPCKADASVYASLWTSSQIANNVFTLGTAAVLPFYTLMVVAPKAEMTKKSMGSCFPYIAFGIVYGYLLYLSWTPGTLQAMFASKYWMPELSAIASLFTNEMSLSSAWIHLLAIDLFAARLQRKGWERSNFWFWTICFRCSTDMIIIYRSLSPSQLSAQICPIFSFSFRYRPGANSCSVPNGAHNKLFGPQLANQEAKRNFARGSRISMRPRFREFMYEKARPNSTVCATSQITTTLFNLGTAIVLPLYILMIFAPEQKMTRTTMESHVPYVALGLLYAYMLALSWTPQHIGALFGGNNMMPDFSRVGALFFSELSATAAWIHLLLMDLFAARQVFLDGLENEIETRHSIVLCLFFCPMGILSHVVTKALTRMSRS